LPVSFHNQTTQGFQHPVTKLTASSKLTSVTTAQVETVGGITAVAERTNVPAALNYEISVTPDANSASGYADGIISTTFTISVMEGATPFLSDADKAVVEGYPVGSSIIWDLPSDNQGLIFSDLTSTLTYIDTATVAGGISTFNKVFSYQSGVACENC